MKLSHIMMAIGVVASVSLAAQEKERAVKSDAPTEESATSIFDAARKSRLSVNLRMGYEHSNLDNNLSPGQSLSLRTRMAFETAKYYDTSVFVQGQIHNNLLEEHSFPGGGDATRDPIADPDGIRVHQAYIENASLHRTIIRGGRQEIILDDARLIGNVGWRQWAQSFDGILLKNSCVDSLGLQVAWLDQVNTISNTSVELKHFGLINAKYSAEPVNVSLFTYLLDAQVGPRDSITYGTRVDGKAGIFDFDITLAQQEDFANGQGHNGYMTNYYGGADVSAFHIGLGYSRISGARGTNTAFDTLFSTAHKFNGWADQFARTNGGNLTDGLQDTYIDLKTKAFDTTILLRYHSFRTTEDGASATHSGFYGDEVDLMFKRSFTVADSNTFNVIVKFALYNELNNRGGTNPTADEVVSWVRLEYSF